MAPRILTDSERVLRDTFKLNGWVQKPLARRARYFRWCDYALADFRGVNGDQDPEPSSIVVTLTGLVQEDGSFFDHASKRKKANYLTNEENWKALRGACAAQIYHEYLVALEKNEWP